MTIKPLIDYSPNDLFKNIMFNSYSLRKPIFAFLEVDNNDVAKRLLRTITAIKEENMREQLEIKENGMWDERARGTMIAVVMNSAYTLALKAVKKMNDIPADIEELKILNSVFALIDSKFKNRNLTISFTNNQLSINFLSSEAFENGTAANSPDSIRYLPLMTVLFNANHRNGEMLKMFMKACEQLNPIRIIKLSTEEFSSSSSVTHNMIDLHNSFLADQLAIYSQSISFTECIALSQKYKLSTEEPLIISQALPQFSIPLNILRKKYFRMSQTLRVHNEL